MSRLPPYYSALRVMETAYQHLSNAIAENCSCTKAGKERIDKAFAKTTDAIEHLESEAKEPALNILNCLKQAIDRMNVHMGST